MAYLNVNPADLLRAADDYTELAARAAAISPQAVAEVTRIIETHGPMGYPVAVGIAVGLAPREAQVAAKIADFGQYAQRLTEHAATYQRTDADGASRMASHFQEPAGVSRLTSGDTGKALAAPYQSRMPTVQAPASALPNLMQQAGQVPTMLLRADIPAGSVVVCEPYTAGGGFMCFEWFLDGRIISGWSPTDRSGGYP